MSKCTIPTAYGISTLPLHIIDQVVSQVIKQVQSLQAQLVLRKPTVVASVVGGPPVSKHLDGTNYSQWKFDVVVHDVRPAPELALNLLSVSQIATQKKTLMFDEYGCQIVDIAVEVLRQHILSTVTQYN
ncbi:hypothetical protein T4D_4837 [Trichinella pseudospiralis]|uniref:Uncharacterized protein n=1 Tax=Trichinella pseudospiralis TaxID=6337 RepID=A0A0V1F545_TRIPS|nr:hypothetical protein T4D_4837 [Trichinella pseudospiralis]